MNSERFTAVIKLLETNGWDKEVVELRKLWRERQRLAIEKEQLTEVLNQANKTAVTAKIAIMAMNTVFASNKSNSPAPTESQASTDDIPRR